MYTEQGNDMLDFMFPSLGVEKGFDPEFAIQEFASFGYWRDDLINVSATDIADLL